MVADFAADGVVYLELRTTPRALPDGTSKRQGVEAVVQTLRECEQSVRTPSGEPIIVRLLLSIDRSQPLSEAEDTVALAAELASAPDPVVVGIDFSGNPNAQSFITFLPLFERARREHGLRCTVHVGEKAGDGDDLDAALRFAPDRIGHVVCLEERHVSHLLAHPLPIEVCPTSNLVTRIVAHLEQHPFGRWTRRAPRNQRAQHTDAPVPYPLVVCTDDSGVFGVTLSEELQRMADAFAMGRDEVFELESRAVELAFVGEAHKQRLRDLFARWGSRHAVSGSAAICPAPAGAASKSALPVAILTFADREGWPISTDIAIMDAFAAAGKKAVHAVWNQPNPQWEQYSAVVLRSLVVCPAPGHWATLRGPCVLGS